MQVHRIHLLVVGMLLVRTLVLGMPVVCTLVLGMLVVCTLGFGMLVVRMLVGRCVCMRSLCPHALAHGVASRLVDTWVLHSPSEGCPR